MKKLTTFASMLLISNISYAETLVAEYFDPSVHQVYNVKIGEITNINERYKIYANGLMQAPIDVELDIMSNIGERVVLKNLIYKDGKPLINIYLKSYGNQNGVLSEDQEHISGWKISKIRNQYDNVLDGQEYDNNNDGSSSNYSMFYATSVSTSPNELFCVKAGSYDSCKDELDSYANVTAISPRIYTSSDFQVNKHNTNWAGYPGHNRLGDSFLYELSLKKDGVHYIKDSYVIEPIHSQATHLSGMNILSQQAVSKNVLLGQDWNWNNTLIHFEQKEDEMKTWNLPYYGFWNDHTQYITEDIFHRKGVVSLYHIYGVVRVINSWKNEGVWGGSSAFFRNGEINMPLIVIDNFGNKSSLFFKKDPNSKYFYLY
ncbi:hypothetical protein GNP63_14275 [Aliivibrio fischeri]|uniref:hypothetical protein n=1 Tax=Aliivibrio fischeri TaxID=668 RepID=UPI0012D86668|nr:hypothetical protein [Aliivibrio fischeri]MUH97700.1 hypothetical protein [Aliivibrio fischeri]MUI62397.1 hypothetical protein [Aliivibrio fischeri]